MKLEVNTKFVEHGMDVLEGTETPHGVFRFGQGTIMVTPNIDKDFWQFRVQLGHGQAIVGFPKFGMIGVGFAKETNWNTNLPSNVPTERIFNHIKENKGNDAISDDDCLKAIRMVKVATTKWQAFETKKKNEKVMAMFPELRGPKGIMTYSQFRKACRVAQQAYAGDYNVVFGEKNDGKQVTFRYSFTLHNNGKGLKSAMQQLYWFLLNVGNGGDVHQYQYFGIDGANFAYNSGTVPNKWTSGLLHVHNFIVSPVRKKRQAA